MNRFKKVLALILSVVTLTCFNVSAYATIPGAVYWPTSGTQPNIGTLPINCGGTALTSTPTNGQLLIGSTSGSGYVLSTLTAGSSKISITNGAGSITLDVNQGNFTLSSLGGSLNLSQLSTSGASTNYAPIYNGSSVSWAAIPAPTGLALNNCRLYLVSSSPYADGSSSGNGTIYFGPCTDRGQYLTLDNGSGVLTTYSVSQISLSLSSGYSASTMYDVYVYNNSGTLTLSTTAWSGSTPPSRSTDALGRLTKSGSTNYLLVGAFYTISSTATADWTGERHLSNVYNKIEKQLQAVITSPSSATQSSASSNTRSANSNTTDGQGRFSFTQCLAVNSFKCFYRDQTSAAPTGNASQTVNWAVGFALDSTSAFDALGTAYCYSAGLITMQTIEVSHTYAPVVGAHYVQALEYNDAGVTVTYYYGSPYQELGAIINN